MISQIELFRDRLAWDDSTLLLLLSFIALQTKRKLRFAARCAFLNELKTSGPLQAAIIVVTLGLLFRHTPPETPPAIWPFLLFAYAVLAALLPWVIAISGGLVLDDDLSLHMAVVLAVLVALPMWLAARWLTSTPYHALSIGCWLLIGMYGLYVIAVIAHMIRSRLNKTF